MLPTKDLFKLFSIPKVYNINKDTLRNEYYKLNKKYHPDLYSNDMFIKHINKGYKTLENDYTRAKYMNEIHGQGDTIHGDIIHGNGTTIQGNGKSIQGTGKSIHVTGTTTHDTTTHDTTPHDTTPHNNNTTTQDNTHNNNTQGTHDNNTQGTHDNNKHITHDTISLTFLENILSLEESINDCTCKNKLINILQDINEYIKKCKDKYYDKQYILQWSYYNRLKDLIDNRMIDMELKHI